jgi:hypothetical protein
MLVAKTPLSGSKFLVFYMISSGRSVVKEVRVKGKEAKFTYTIPLTPGGILEERVGLLPIVHAGLSLSVQ